MQENVEKTRKNPFLLLYGALKLLSHWQGGFQSGKKWKNSKLELEGQRSNVIVSGFAEKRDWLPDFLP